MKRLLLISVFALSVLAQPTGEIVHRFSAEMNRPTDIAILEDGRICVADGVNARVVIFQPNGVFKALTLPGMKRPLGLASDVGGGLLISDTEADAIFILDHNLNLKVQLPLASEIDATDILPVNDYLWVVDNDGHRVLVMDRKGRIKQEVGRKGSAGPTLNYPATISFGKNQQIYICDVLNGRIQLFETDGQYRGQIADWGVRVGSFFRPKGVAAKSTGPFVVSDSFTGVIHYFRNQSDTGSIIQTRSSEPLHLKNPLGMAWGANDLLWVVESGSGDVLGIKLQ